MYMNMYEFYLYGPLDIFSLAKTVRLPLEHYQRSQHALCMREGEKKQRKIIVLDGHGRHAVAPLFGEYVS